MEKILVISPDPTHLTIAGNRTCILSYIEMLKKMNMTFIFFG
jgi:hypothetical protein